MRCALDVGNLHSMPILSYVIDTMLYLGLGSYGVVVKMLHETLIWLLH